MFFLFPADISQGLVRTDLFDFNERISMAFLYCISLISAQLSDVYHVVSPSSFLSNETKPPGWQLTLSRHLIG